ncbi:CAMP-responsive element modulator isoform X13 [Oopsacas minuta]|uniref:cAMP-responsive element modulator isoform X13 n=1 Tax=Oopsacas minuta TaxID=111878 RepID=A0AAV7JLD1_9METZ|nr:CAMP-responsive element modulator isoform X13 [Oopsacas minuta]
MQHFSPNRRILDDLAGNSALNPEIKKEPMRDQIDCIDNNSENQPQQPMLPPNMSQEMTMPNQVNVLSSAAKYVFQNPGQVQLLTTSAGHEQTSINPMSLSNQTSAIRPPYQSIHPGMLSPALFMTPQAITTQQQMADEAAKKREIRLQKNRLAAKECRRKKKEYVKCLESRVQVLENQNKALIDELRSLKDLYLPKNTDVNAPNRPSNSDTGLKDASDPHQ